MKLRSGKTLYPVVFKHKGAQTLGEKHTEMIVKTTVTEPEINLERMKELKTFFTSLFYHCCKNIGYKEWIDEIERTKGRKVTVDELLNWKADESFWKENFQKTWFRVQREVPPTILLQAFDYFIAYEYDIKSDHPESVIMKGLVRNCICDLYYQNSSAKLLELMFEQNQIDVDYSKKIYLQELASDLASQVVNPLFNNRPCLYTWEQFFKKSNSSCCFIPNIEGGRTVIRSSLVFCNFAMGSVPKYHFMIVETREKFSSPEKDPKKAFFIHRKLKVPMSCSLQSQQEH